MMGPEGYSSSSLLLLFRLKVNFKGVFGACVLLILAIDRSLALNHTFVESKSSIDLQVVTSFIIKMSRSVRTCSL